MVVNVFVLSIVISTNRRLLLNKGMLQGVPTIRTSIVIANDKIYLT